MKLHISREQKEIKGGCFGGHTGSLFTLKIQLEASPSEVAAMQQQGLHDKILSEYTDPIINSENRVWSGNILNKENSHFFRDLPTSQRVEQEVIQACKSIKSLVEGAAGFSGSSSIEL